MHCYFYDPTLLVNNYLVLHTEVDAVAVVLYFDEVVSVEKVPHLGIHFLGTVDCKR